MPAKGVFFVPFSEKVICKGTSMTKLNNVVMRVINGVVISVTILVTLFMRSSGSVHSVLASHCVAGEIL